VIDEVLHRRARRRGSLCVDRVDLLLEIRALFVAERGQRVASAAATAASRTPAATAPLAELRGTGIRRRSGRPPGPAAAAAERRALGQVELLAQRVERRRPLGLVRRPLVVDART